MARRMCAVIYDIAVFQHNCEEAVIIALNQLREKKNVIRAIINMQAAMITKQLGQPKVDIGGHPFVATIAPCKEEGEAKQSKKRESGI